MQKASLFIAALLALAACDMRPQTVDTEGADPRVIQARGTLAESERATIAIFESVSPSVVLVISGNPNGLSGEVGAGTGFVWDEAGPSAGPGAMPGLRALWGPPAQCSLRAADSFAARPARPCRAGAPSARLPVLR
jgi:hypothetical protein